ALRTASVLGNSTGEIDYDAGNSSAQTPRVVIATDQSPLPIDPNEVDFGATTDALRTAAVLGNSLGELSYGAGITDQQTPRVVIASDQSPLAISNLPDPVNTDYGTPDA